MGRQRLAGIIAFVLLSVLLGCSGSDAADPSVVEPRESDLPSAPNVEQTIAAALELGALPDLEPDAPIVVDPRDFPSSLATALAPPAPPIATPVPPTNTPAPTATPGPTSTLTPTPTRVPTATPAPTATPVPTAIPTPVATPTPTIVPTATAVPTATPEPNPTPVPTPTPNPVATIRPNFTGLIPSLTARVTALRFFETGDVLVPTVDRVYRPTLNQSTTRSVAWELNLAHPPPASQTAFTVDAVYYRPDGSVQASLTHAANLPAASTLSSNASGSGWTLPGNWPIGIYKVDLSVDSKLVASGEFEIVDLLVPFSERYFAILDGLAWSTGALSYDNRRDMESLASLMRKDPGLAATVAAYSWVKAGPSSTNRGALEYLALLANQDLVLTKQLADTPWLRDGITKNEWVALKYFNIISQQSRPLARSLAAIVWTNDDLTLRESQALEHLAFFAVENQASAHIIAGFSWFVDNLSVDEVTVLADLRAVAVQDLTLFQNITRNPWVADGPSGDGRAALASIKLLASRDISLARYVASYAWASDDITTHEAYSLNFITALQKLDATLGTKVSGFPWVVDDITQRERFALRDIVAIAGKDVAVAKVVAGLSWLTFDINQDEGEALTRFKELLIQDADVAKLVAGMPFLTTSFEASDKEALLSMLNLSINHAAVLTLITKQAWFLDGLDDQEAMFIRLVDTPQGRFFGPSNFNTLVVKNYGESRTVNMPLSGELKITVFQSSNDPRNSGIIGQMEESLRAMEGFMGVPFPREEVILLVASPVELKKGLDFEFTGINRGSHIVVNTELGRQGDTNRVITHELAHYYWGTDEVPLWFREGGAFFLASYVRDTRFGESMADRSVYTLSRAVSVCQSTGPSNIASLIEKLALDGLVNHQNATYFTCNHDQGENLFLELYNTLGPDSFRSSWKELYELAKREGRAVNETEIYRAFLGQTTTATENRFKDIYGRLHGGIFEE